MTNAKQVYRRMSDDLRGPIYARQDESTLHVLREFGRRYMVIAFDFGTLV